MNSEKRFSWSMLYWDCAERPDEDGVFFVTHLSRYIILPVAAATLLLAGVACGGGGDEDVPSNAIAVVGGGETITKAEFDRLLNQARQSYKDSSRPFPKAGTDEYVQLRDQIVQYLVRRAQFASEADGRGIDISDEQIDKRLDQLIQQYFQGNKKRYEDQLKKNGVSNEQVRADIEAQLVQEELFKDVTKDVEVTQAEMLKYYNQNKQQYSTPAQRDIRHILLKKNQRSLAASLAAQIRDGANFAQLAKRHSQDPGSKRVGGRLEISKGQTVPPFDKVAFSIKTRAVSDPVKTQYGWHVIQAMAAVVPAKTTPFKDVQQAIRQQLLQDKKSKETTKYVEQLQKNDDVDYQVGFAPRKTNTVSEE
jgi:parvulin-like peptidyl-prolyl isomerase